MKTFEEYRFTIKHTDIKVKPTSLLSLKKGDYFYLIRKSDNVFRRCTLCKEIKLDDDNLYAFKYIRPYDARIIGVYADKDDIKEDDLTVCADKDAWITIDYDKAIELCKSNNIDTNKIQNW